MAFVDAFSDDDVGESEGTENSSVTSPEALNMVRTLKDFLLEHSTASEADVCNGLRCLDKVGDIVVRNAIATRQQVTTDFFK